MHRSRRVLSSMVTVPLQIRYENAQTFEWMPCVRSITAWLAPRNLTTHSGSCIMPITNSASPPNATPRIAFQSLRARNQMPASRSMVSPCGGLRMVSERTAPASKDFSFSSRSSEMSTTSNVKAPMAPICNVRYTGPKNSRKIIIGTSKRLCAGSFQWIEAQVL